MAEEMFWADQIARKVVAERGDKEKYVVAAGITPSGTVHIGNFREMITVDLVARALASMGKKVRFIYSWDDYDRLRKVPANVPKKEELEKFMGYPVVDAPDTFGCHANYAEHMEREVSDALPTVGINPEFIFQSKMYRKCAYAEEIRTCMLARDKIRPILNKFRKGEDPLPESWYPMHVFCEKCKKDDGHVTKYDGEYTIEYECACGNKGKLDFRKDGRVKLPWRVDWPMRWHFEKVDFEPGGKDHSAPGGSRDTAALIVSAVYGNKPPVYQMYDFVIPKTGGKMSKSLGNVIKLTDILKIYLPEMVRFFFAGTKPIKEFSIPMDEEIFKVYEDFYETERIFYGKETGRAAHWKRVYEMSCIGAPAKELPAQPSFRQCIELINAYGNPKRAVASLGKLSAADKKRHLAVLECAKNWTETYAPETFRAVVNDKVPDGLVLSEAQRKALHELGNQIELAHSEQNLKAAFEELPKKFGLSTGDFFKAAYLVLIGKERGPRLIPFIESIGAEKVAKLLKSV